MVDLLTIGQGPHRAPIDYDIQIGIFKEQF